ncbi:hypothetical protein [Xanthomonas translucens]|uniref:hypothetical protein n=1 Tax=Xanthomonas campestris pv. translucens TaxID=343 RepID=UPI00071E8219|nr:hypothetical protein [Xanthomonas translucens]
MNSNSRITKFAPVKIVTGVVAAAAVVMSGSAFAAGTAVADALTAGIDKADLLAGGAVILGACAVVAMIGLGRRLAK